MHTIRTNKKINDPEGIYFTTSSSIEWIPIFTSISYFDIMIQSMRYCQKEKNLKIYAYVILENHFHMICQSTDLSKTMQSLKRHTSSSILRQLEYDQKDWILNLMKFYKKQHKRDSQHQLWQEGFHPKQIVSDDMFRQKVEYIHYNPVKRGYVELSEHWLYSSAGIIISGKTGPIAIESAPI